jgi:hypothetical protein
MILALLNWIARCRPSFMIPSPDGSDYLLRVKLRGGLPRDPRRYRWSLFLHKIIQTDLDRHLHNHPWTWAVAIPVWGGYEEERLLPGGVVVTRRVRPFTLNFLGPGQFHRITKLYGKECWTLFFGGRKTQDWGFIIGQTLIIPHDQYARARASLARFL